MKVLYYLEPWIELDFPNFRLGTIRNHLRKEASSLIRSGCNVTLLCSEAIKHEAVKSSLLPSAINFLTIENRYLTSIAPNYFAASMQPFKQLVGNSFLDKYAEIIGNSLGDYEPEVVIAYETAFSQFLRILFPKALVLDSTLGAFSREPYPETFCYDPFGSFSESVLNKLHIDELCPEVNLGQAESFIEPIRDLYASALKSTSPFDEIKIRKKFDTVLLLPLQVSRYFAFDAFLPEGVKFNTQFEYLCWVLESVPKNIGVYVTEHGFSPVITDRNYKWLKSQYPHFLYEESNRNIKWVSQYLLQHVDGVITVSSSLGFQAALFDKFVCVPGVSHLSAFSDETILNNIDTKKIIEPLNKAKYLYFILNKYNPLFDKYVLQDGWHANRIEKFYAKKDSQISSNSFELLDEPEVIRDHFLDSIRPCYPAFVKPVSRGKKTSDKSKLKIAEYRIRKSAIKAGIDSAKIVSFDIFDTLLVRNFLRPEQLNRHIAVQSSKQLREWGHFLNVEEYLDLRKKAAVRLMTRAREVGIEDITLREIFNELRKILKVSKDQAAVLRKIETDAEFHSIRKRKDFYDIYQYAVSKQKEIYFVSDMYLDEDFVSHLLKKHDFGAQHTLLLSSAIGKLKKSGNLYEYLLDVTKVKPNEIYHIGDNENSDYKAANEKGINAAVINKISDVLYSNDAFLTAFSPNSRDVWNGLQQGISARLISESGVKSNNQSLVLSSPFLLGAVCGGPIILAFAKWVFDQAKGKGVDKVFFLARDGWYPKKAFDMIKSVVGGSIQSEYLLASRRAVIGSAIYDFEDLIKSLDAAFSQCTLAFFLESRFGLKHGEGYEENELNKQGASLNTLVDSKNDESLVVLRKVLDEFGERILENARKEREAYICYLNNVGFTDDKKIAIVDIGHNGTLQLGLGKLTSKNIEGFYFATFHKAQQLVKQGHGVNSYLLEYENSSRSEHFYCKNIGMFEFLFIPDQASFSRMLAIDNGHAPEFVPYDESARVKLAEQVELGIECFCAEFIKTLGASIADYSPDPNSVVVPYKHFIEQPSQSDVHMIQGVCFSDAFGGNKSRYLIDPRLFTDNITSIDTLKKQELIRASWWRAGAIALLEAGVEKIEPTLKVLERREKFWRPFIRPFVYRLANEQNKNYFEVSPRRFFSNLSNKHYRRIGRLLFGG